MAAHPESGASMESVASTALKAKWEELTGDTTNVLYIKQTVQKETSSYGIQGCAIKND